jgi:putative photosynthetic complex assembly protein
MSSHAHDAVPRTPLMAVGGLILMTLVMVAVVRLTGWGDNHRLPAQVVAERSLHFSDLSNGGIAVHDAASGQLLEQLAPGSNGFLRGALRGLSRERKRSGIGPEPSLRLSGHSDGRLLLEDPQTGRMIDLGSFGPTNAAVFARLLTAVPSEPAKLALNHGTGS